jgi:flagellin
MARIQGSAKFNGKHLLNATATDITFQIGLDNASSDQITLTFGGLGLTSLLASGTNVSGASSTNSLTALSEIDDALTTISTLRARYGAGMNRLEVTTSSIQTMRLNLSAANSRIRDVDVAEETAMLSRNQILSQAGVSVLSQANQLPQMALSLLQG